MEPSRDRADAGVPGAGCSRADDGDRDASTDTSGDGGDGDGDDDGDDASADAGDDASADAGAGDCDAPDAGDGGDDTPPFDCEMAIEVGRLSPATCAVVDPVSHRVGRLRWVCGGGPARLGLGDLVLDGSVNDDVLELSACREDPVSWLDGHYELVSISADLRVERGSLSFSRATGLSCARAFNDCNATASVTLYP
ncbi:MAG: hypothetical protein KIT84_28885 [Labilithrix sp.]|nr:hypothetical protein [Labilithrix sp.]